MIYFFNVGHTVWFPSLKCLTCGPIKINITCCWISRDPSICKTGKSDNNALDIDAIYYLNLEKHNLIQLYYQIIVDSKNIRAVKCHNLWKFIIRNVPGWKLKHNFWLKVYHALFFVMFLSNFGQIKIYFVCCWVFLI
jgi:hypothetical protein